MFMLFTFSPVTTNATARQPSPRRHVSATWAVVAILAAATLLTLSPVRAQVSQQFSQQTGFIDPPGRVARINLAEGPVSFASADTGGYPRWTPALLNRPLTTGDRLWTGQRARSELHIGSTAVRLDEQTSLDFLELDDDTSQLRLAQGTMKLRVRQLFDGQRIEINTPNLAFVITQPGDYRLDAIPASNASAGTTRVVVQQGAGTIYGDGGAQVVITSGQQANFTDTQLTPAGPAPEVQDGFDAWAHQRDRLEDQSVSARYIPREVIGYQQLDSYGDWSQDPTYGAVWLPRAVPVNWAPYRAGHWSWIAPWGWTWVDDAPWGFAPFHYGRWAQIGPRWAWVPGRLAARPVYAPALVAFIGGNAGGVNWNVSIGQQAARPGLGWFPLAPGEAFRPAYQHSPRYVTNLNQNIVVTNPNVIINYRYQQRGDAVSALSADDFARSQRVRPEWQRLNAADLGRAQLLAPERGGLPQRLPGLAGLRDMPRVVSPAALPPDAVAVRPVVASQFQLPGQRDDRRGDRRDDRLNDPRQNDPQGNARVGRPVDSLGQQPRPVLPVLPRQPVQVIPPALPQQGAVLDRGAFEAEQRTRAEQQRQQRELTRQQQDRTGGQRQPTEESLGQRALREQALRNENGNVNPNPALLPVQPGLPAAGRDPIEQAQREQQRLQRDQQRQQVDTARHQEQQRRQADESLGQRALQEQAVRQQQVQTQQAQQVQQAQQRAQQEQQRQARDQQQQQHSQRQQAQEQQTQQAQQAQQRTQQEQARQQQMVQQQQLQQRAQQEQQRQARDQPLPPLQQQRQQADQPREAARERQQQRRADAPNGGPPRGDERGNR